MSEQKQRQVTADELFPLWTHALKTGNTDKVLDMSTTKFCIVGETHGFIRPKCIPCREYGYKLTEAVSGQTIKFESAGLRMTEPFMIFSQTLYDRTISRFVNHINTQHPEIVSRVRSMKKKEKKENDNI